MSGYRIEYTRAAAKAFQDLPPDIRRRVARKVDALASNPRPSGVKAMHGMDVSTYRLRVGDYRVLYTVEDDVLLVLVVGVGHQREIYR